MKTFISISTLTITILIIWISSTTLQHSKNLVYDDEQEGLKDQIIIRFSHVVAENTPKGLAAQKFADLVQKKTNGKIKVEVYPNGILYPDGEEIDALIRGDIQMVAPTFTKMTEFVPEWKVLDLPFLFQNDEQVENVFTGSIGKELIEKLDEKHMKGMTFWSNGFKQMSSSKGPLITPADFKGQSFRVMPGEMIEKQFWLLHANPVAQPFNSVYHSLEIQELDGQENTISNIYSKGLYKVQDHLTLSNHGYLGYAVIMNSDFWRTLSASEQKQINSALAETSKWIQQESRNMNDAQLEEIKNSSSIQIHTLTKEQQKLWKDAFTPLYKSVEKEIGAEFLYKIQQASE
ncbi:DctP family TRAP transporter solute-binding subunit [Neobacillus sp. LXY-4]|uniref:DctP family TRAP transporter solute-binding subunit n=1 Tax=Neobacillus sp. LXY-4 TaxID=3379826 RepID=UPI003EE1FF77